MGPAGVVGPSAWRAPRRAEGGGHRAPNALPTWNRRAGSRQRVARRRGARSRAEAMPPQADRWRRCQVGRAARTASDLSSRITEATPFPGQPNAIGTGADAWEVIPMSPPDLYPATSLPVPSATVHVETIFFTQYRLERHRAHGDPRADRHQLRRAPLRPRDACSGR